MTSTTSPSARCGCGASRTAAAYGVVYDDGDSLRLDLRYDAAAPADEAIVTEQVGHLDQLCHVTGLLETGDGAQRVAIDCFAVRDRSWYVPRDQRSMRAGYTYGAVDADEHFLVFSRPSPGDDERYDVHGGYLVRHGRQAAITSGTRSTVSRRAATRTWSTYAPSTPTVAPPSPAAP